MEFYDAEHRRHAEERQRARLERQLRAAETRRKRAIALVLIAGALAASFLFATVVYRRPAAVATRLASAASPVALDRTPAIARAAAVAIPRTQEPPRLAEAAPPAPVAPAKPAPAPAPKPKAPSAQKVSIAIGGAGYQPDLVRVKAGVPVSVTVGKGEGCAAGFYMPELGVQKDNSEGPVTFRIGPLKAGTYVFTCGMGMVSGQLIAE